MKKIIVIGCPGSGKSTFAKALHKITGIPLFHLDMLYWNADKTTVERSVFRERLTQVMQQSQWIIDGNYASTMELRLQVCDTVIFLDYPQDLCLEGIRERRGKPRSDMPWIETEEDAEFIEFIKSFHAESRPQILELLGQYPEKDIYRFTERAEADRFLDQLSGGMVMRKNFGAKEMCYPMPVFIIGTYNEDGTPNAMNAAWGGVTEEAELTICVEAGHKTAKNIQSRKAFTVSMGTAEYVTACDYVGIVSGNKEPDKFKKAGFHATKSEFVDAPLIDELPMALECEMISYDPDSCRLVGRVINVCVDEAYLDGNGKVDVAKLRPITFDPVHHQYLVVGEKVGQAFYDGLTLK